MNLFKILKEYKELKEEVENLKLQIKFMKNEFKRINECLSEKKEITKETNINLYDVSSLRRKENNGE